MEIALFRAVQEALTNIAKHAKAESVLIQCSLSQGKLRIEIEDDGRGFQPEALAAPGKDGRGWGLLGIGERVELLGGVVKIESAPEQGTHIAIEVPVPVEAAHG
jgi:signal transduction histidine kinase